MQKLTIGGIISNGLRIGFKNLPSVLGALVLWLITIWIPYLNVGTTIAVCCGLVVALSKGGVISPTEIFKDSYRQFMGEFFLLAGLLYLGVFAGLIFFVIPGIVIVLAWSQAFYLLVDRGLNVTECLTTSNRITYGRKWTIFLGCLILKIIALVVVGVVVVILARISGALAVVVGILGCLGVIAIMLGACAHVYGVLSSQLNVSETPTA